MTDKADMTATEMISRIKEKTGRRVTKEKIDGLIGLSSIKFLQGGDLGTLTICVVTLPNGYQLTGESACIDPANYDAELGRSIAKQKAAEKLWALEAYYMAEIHHQEQGQ